MISLEKALDAIARHAALDAGAAGVLAPWQTRDCPKPWEGRFPSRPWDHRVTAAIPHLSTPEPLALVVRLLRLQTVRPYVLVIDTGSDKTVCQDLEVLRGEGVEVHYLRAHAWRHPSAPVTAAMDTAFALCQTDYLFATHADVFPRRRDLLAHLLSFREPVVGYEMSQRAGTDKWQGVVSHTCTLFDMRALRRAGATWSLERYLAEGHSLQEVPGWPDTESGLDLCLKRAGVPIHFVGHDRNYLRQADEWIDHARSYTGAKLYGAGTQMEHLAEVHMRLALSEARQRLAEWEAGDDV